MPRSFSFGRDQRADRAASQAKVPVDADFRTLFHKKKVALTFVSEPEMSFWTLLRARAREGAMSLLAS